MGKSRWTYHLGGFKDAAELRGLRKAAGWTQRDLAQRAGVHVCTVKYHERREGFIGGVAPRRFRDVFEAASIGLVPPKTVPQAAGAKLCGARTRNGGRCKAKAMPGRSRCKLHGGMSTGPKSPEGRARIAEAQRARWIRVHQEHGGGYYAE